MTGYLYDPHTHTKETSKCGYVSAALTVERYHKNGFAGLVVTDHLHPEYLSGVDTDHDWQKVMDLFLAGYKAAKKRGDELDFDVILGVELRFPENDNDYLVYGIDENWLRSNPYVCCMSAQEFFDKFHDEVLIIHAHPFRNGSAPVQETAVHGAEIINGNPRHANHNDMAWELCCRHPAYFRTAGSDAHEDGDEARAGVALPERVKDSHQFKRMLETKQFRVWGPEFQEFVDMDEAKRREEGTALML